MFHLIRPTSSNVSPHVSDVRLGERLVYLALQRYVRFILLWSIHPTYQLAGHGCETAQNDRDADLLAAS